MKLQNNRINQKGGSKIKNKKVIAFICIIISTLLLIQAGFYIIALDESELLRIIVSDREIIGVQTDNMPPLQGFTGIDELEPMMANNECVSSFDWSASHHNVHQTLDVTKENHGVFTPDAYSSLVGLTPTSCTSLTVNGSIGTYTYNYSNAGTHYSYGNSQGTCNNITVIVNMNTSQVITAYPSL